MSQTPSTYGRHETAKDLEDVEIRGPYRLAKANEDPTTFLPVVLKNGNTDYTAPTAGLSVVDERTKSHLYVGITNLTELPLVYVLYQSVPEFWGVLQPGQRAFRYLHWINAYNLVCYPFTGNNEPTIHTHPPDRLAPNSVSLIAAASNYAFSHGASSAAAGTALATVASIVKSPITFRLAAESVIGPAMLNNPNFFAAFNRATAQVHSDDPFKANGQSFHVVGGIQRDRAFGDWRGMRMTWQT
ncbi:hypothetical protein K443DRAFT_125428 [Laccaria amethystina LaAM-08-1]|uniref:Uncharacterized protein n=1 Tax=Laccaria amethystina LaAM-08-1 TaxID=1095629 RepID=A0A0C9XCL3_9AGAR|nr:hypothetical protein K443DRAFT_125428 [Laccaria amethystina LaAM-08-1]